MAGNEPTEHDKQEQHVNDKAEAAYEKARESTRKGDYAGTQIHEAEGDRLKDAINRPKRSGS